MCANEGKSIILANAKVTGGDGSLDYPFTRAREPPIIYFGVTTCHRRASTSRPAPNALLRRVMVAVSARAGNFRFVPITTPLGPASARAILQAAKSLSPRPPASNAGGPVRPSALAVTRLMTSSNLVGGRIPGSLLGASG